MSPTASVLALASAAALLLLPRRWAPVPLVAGACYMTLGQGLEVGPFTFTFIRMLIAVGVVRLVLRREPLAGGLNRLDWLIVLWGAWACLSSALHEDPASALVYRLGMVYNACGIYFILRVLCVSPGDVVRLVQSTAIVLAVVAASMAYERATLHNPFSAFGAVAETPMVREGRVRASGPFAHPILAGTVGAVCMPLMIGIGRHGRMIGWIGCLSCLVMVGASASSSPVVSLCISLASLALWQYRRHLRLLLWAGILCLIALSVLMKAPIYYLIARLDIVGGSTGWHRSRLIESAFEHLDEWWLAGTDYTRHWMGEGMLSDPTQVDITNHYLRLGVIGGLPLVLLFCASLATAFVFVGRSVRSGGVSSVRDRFIVWALGCALVAHAATFMAVSYFDQSFVFLYLTLAAVASTGAAATGSPVTVCEATDQATAGSVTGPSGRWRTRSHSAPSAWIATRWDTPIGTGKESVGRGGRANVNSGLAENPTIAESRWVGSRHHQRRLP